MKSDQLEQHTLTGQNFGYSAAALGDLGATQYTLVTILVDRSGSTAGFIKEMEACIKKAVEACKMSPRADYLMIRVIIFDDSMQELHGFKQIQDINPNDYDGCLTPGGATLLFDTVLNAVTAMADYGAKLFDADFDVNAILIAITDGMDNRSHCGPARIAEEFKNVKRAEKLESLLAILVGVGTGEYSDVQQYLDQFVTDGKLDKYINIADAEPKQLAKLADFISKSVSSQSQALGTGQTSQVLQF